MPIALPCACAPRSGSVRRPRRRRPCCAGWSRRAGRPDHGVAGLQSARACEARGCVRHGSRLPSLLHRSRTAPAPHPSCVALVRGRDAFAFAGGPAGPTRVSQVCRARERLRRVVVCGMGRDCRRSYTALAAALSCNAGGDGVVLACDRRSRLPSLLHRSRTTPAAAPSCTSGNHGAARGNAAPTGCIQDAGCGRCPSRVDCQSGSWRPPMPGEPQ